MDRLANKYKELFFTPPFPPDILEQMYTQYSRPLTVYLHRRLDSRASHLETARDLAQDVFVRAGMALSAMEEALKKNGGVLRAKDWLFTISNNLATDWQRRQRIRWEDIDNDVDFLNKTAPDNPLREVIQQESKNEVREIIGEVLLPRERTAIDLYLSERLTIVEIGGKVGGSEEATKQLLRRVRIKLRAAYLRKHPGEFDFN